MLRHADYKLRKLIKIYFLVDFLRRAATGGLLVNVVWFKWRVGEREGTEKSRDRWLRIAPEKSSERKELLQVTSQACAAVEGF